MFVFRTVRHSTKAVHEAYAKGAYGICPALDEYENLAAEKLAPMPPRATWPEQAARAVS